MKHNIIVEKYDGSLSELAIDITSLDYNSLSSLLLDISFNLKNDAISDNSKGRVKLSNELEKAAIYIALAHISIDKAKEICKPYMSANTEENNE